MPNWETAHWDSHGNKHRPPPGEAWKALIAETVHSPGYYRPEISVQQQQALEMECIDLYQAGDPNVHLIRETGSKRTFWRDLGVVIGASDGEETTFVFVEWTASGTVHGRPISAAELRRKGA